MNISRALPLVCSFFLYFLLPLSLTHVPLSLSLTHFPVEVLEPIRDAIKAFVAGC